MTGDPALTPFDDTPGNPIEPKFYSFHTNHHGGHSHAFRKRPSNVHAATPAEMVEHGCWHQGECSTGDVPTHYREWTIEDHVYLSFLCMQLLIHFQHCPLFRGFD